MKTTTEIRWLKLSEVALRLGISAKTVQRWCDAGLLTHRKYPTGHYAVSSAEVERLERESLRERVKILVTTSYQSGKSADGGVENLTQT